MNVLLRRDGQQFGPYPIEQIPEMLRYGNLQPSDLVCPEGGTEWIPLSMFITAQPPPPASKPPPLPIPAPPVIPDATNPNLTAPVSLGGSKLAGTQGMTIGDLERAVEQGGRFVIYQYCFSVLVLTFRRSSDIIFLRPGDDGFSHAFTNSLLSLLFGWWGIPWGPIWTIQSLAINCGGGRDITPEVLQSIAGPTRTAALLSRRPPVQKGGRIKALGWGLAGIALLLVLCLAGLIILAANGNRREDALARQTPGHAQFEAANRQLNAFRGQAGLGNSPAAIAVATDFANKMKAIRDVMFEGGKKDGLSLSDHQFLTWCELHDDRCVLLVHVPELRRFKSEAKEALGQVAWRTALETLDKKSAGKPNMRVVVALRGVLSYDRVLSGRYSDNPVNAAGAVTTDTSLGAKQSLYRLFEETGAIVP